MMAKQVCCSTSSKLSKISINGNCCFVVPSFSFSPFTLSQKSRSETQILEKKISHLQLPFPRPLLVKLWRKSSVTELKWRLCCKIRQNKGSELRKKLKATLSDIKLLSSLTIIIQKICLTSTLEICRTKQDTSEYTRGPAWIVNNILRSQIWTMIGICVIKVIILKLLNLSNS